MISLTPQFTIQSDDHTTQARFTIEPLPQGYGHTLGNSLRRVLYTSIPGAAITSVNITGTNHQFTTLPGVREDVVQVILNLKQIRLQYSGDSPVQIELSAKGPGQVKAGDFQLPPDVIIANPQAIVAHLSDKSAKLELVATVEAGLGYSPADDRKSTTVGAVPTDATFTPVTRVNFSVEATRVGRFTNFDKLILDITTNGTVSPARALSQASQTLVGYFSAIANPQTPSSVSGPSVGSSPSSSTGSSLSVEELDLPTRIANALQKAGLETVAQLTALPKAQLAKVKNLGSKSVKIIEIALKERGFDFVL